MEFTEAEAKLKLGALNSGAEQIDRIDVVTRLTNAGLPQEVITRINELWETTRVISGQIFNIGKIILSEIIRFIENNSHMAVGVAIGAAVGSLTSMIPFIGPLLTPLATAITAVVGGIAGYRLDQGREPDDGTIGVSQDLISIAKNFFELLANIFNALRAHFS